MNNYVLAVDLDGVLFGFETEFCDRFGYSNRHLANLFDRDLGVDPELIQEFVDSPETYEDLPPLFGGFTFVRIAQSLGFTILYVTSRPESALPTTEKALARYGLASDKLFLVKDKAKFIELFNASGNIKIRMLLDDIPANLEKLPEGVVGICWEQPWNEGKYPRARYNDYKMTLEYKSDSVSNWEVMFKEKK